ncbi:tetratricopeptide repeat protein [Paenibacillus antri]|uniref:Tetratricopeptide repeat protein n=1 Tax=Paenibacillus antri TaxID=2582848 RepID=A0A5R9G751_9BACL|nr:tetratricopeptide repeat protein [Paenibacillus antri]TLS51541.1 tetratricopeptide repeat protein [Paenibacillus antri]
MPPVQAVILLVIFVLLLAAFYALRPTWYAGRGNAELMKGNAEKALRLFEKSANLPNAKPPQAIGYAYLLMKAGDPVKAERVLEEALPKTKPGIPRMQGQLNLATALWLQGKRDEAVALLEEVHKEYKNTTVYANLGYFKLLRGDLEEALAINREAQEYNDSDVSILDNLAQTYYMLGRYEEAAQWYEKTIEKKPKHAESYYYYALTLQKLGKPEEALEQARAAAGKPLSLVTPCTREAVDGLAVDMEKSSMLYKKEN